MYKILLRENSQTRVIQTQGQQSLLEILRNEDYSIYAPCGGKGRCGKCLVDIKGEGKVLACNYYPAGDIEVILPAKEEAQILATQTAYLEDFPPAHSRQLLHPDAYGAAIDLGTTTIVCYFVHLASGRIVKISSWMNPQTAYGADVISRISYCQENPGGLKLLQKILTESINKEFNSFLSEMKAGKQQIQETVIAGNTTMLHILLGYNPEPLALAPFTPAFTAQQVLGAENSSLLLHPQGRLITLPCLSAYVGSDIVAGLAVLKVPLQNYLFLDIGTNGEMALVKGKEIFTCATAAGPAFEGAGLSSGMPALKGAIAAFEGPSNYKVIGDVRPVGICGSGVIDSVAWLRRNHLMDESGLIQQDFEIYPGIQITQADIREIQLAKSAIYSGIKILLKRAGLNFQELEALFLAGGLGNYIHIPSAVEIGLLPAELKDKTFAVGNSAGIGALQFLRSEVFANKVDRVIQQSQYIELSDDEDFALEFAMNMDFLK
jgi:uncharacterized 2Fe-2S/4Fe-4S cluster protein (DUF4445 family)